jgi:hypothetical protein
VRIEIVRQGVDDEIVWSDEAPGSEHAVPADAARSGCDWAFGLDDPQVAAITRNVLRRFLA